MKRFNGFFAAVLVAGATPVIAQDYVSRHLELSQAFQAEMGRVTGRDPNWTVPADMRAQMVCAIGELEKRRGGAVVEAYLQWSAWAVGEARKLDGIGGFGSLMSQVHRRSGLDLNDDLVPINQVCGIGL